MEQCKRIHKWSRRRAEYLGTNNNRLSGARLYLQTVTEEETLLPSGANRWKLLSPYGPDVRPEMLQ